MSSFHLPLRVALPLALGLLLARCGGEPEITRNSGGDPSPSGGAAGAAGSVARGGSTMVGLPQGGAGDEPGDGGSAGSEPDAPVCGNGVLDRGEGCDDGNTLAGDGCNGACRVEPSYLCPTPGEPCVYDVTCGDGKITGDEACDDGNAEAEDGCSDQCAVEHGYSCRVPGEACVPTQSSECGNGAVEFGETCDDGNGEEGDGCDASCQQEPGYHCPQPGSACVADEFCGDGRQSDGEDCDDGNTESGDGCNGACQLEPFHHCDKPGQPCVSDIQCGDGKVVGDEACDDGNEVDGDGCSADCRSIEPLFECPPKGGACVRELCGDGRLSSKSSSAACRDGDPSNDEGCELCDDGNNISGDGCSANCTLELGFACDESGTMCHRTKCGDGVREGFEQCDDHNVVPFDGCSPDCRSEPKCADATGKKTACSKVCGDGIKFPDEQCDDGNTRDGDGCSSICEKEAGYECPAPSSDPQALVLPVIYRDFSPGLPSGTAAGHPDFEWNEFGTTRPFYTQPTATNGINFDIQHPLAPAQPNVTLTTGLAAPGLFTGAADDPQLGKPAFAFTSATCPLSQTGTSGKWLRRNNVLYCANTVRDAASFAQWFTATPAPPPAGREYRTMTLVRCPLDPALATAVGNRNPCKVADDGTYLFDSNSMLSTADPEDLDASFCGTNCAGFFPLDDLGTTHQCANSAAHNFHFTSEVHQWFQYDPNANATLTFRGDDDVFVFINGRLVVDLGGVHEAVEGSVVVNAATKDVSGASLNLVSGAIYEIAVFQAERNTCLSNYRLQLKNFAFQTSQCHSVCGDGVVTRDEECDEGSSNVSPSAEIYGKCTTQCRRGPRCGDGVKNGPEQCDDGKNDGTWGTCSPGCVLPPRCGDGEVQAEHGELCDAGEDNLPPNSRDAYGEGLCTTACRPAPFCGDHAVDVSRGEVCDDGVNSGEPGSCAPDCKSWVELPSCGDGKRDKGEDCDDGADNGAASSSCDVRCRSKCGNGIKDAGEECDDGVNDGSWGTCNQDCTRAGYCGDGEVNGPEECDPPDANQSRLYGAGTCTAACKKGPYCGDGRIQSSFGEQCDGTSDCGSDCKSVIPR